MPTEEQRANLDKLATYLESLSDDYKKFSMYSFFCGPISESEFDLETVAKRIKNGANPCGTVACAIGHGPAAGISVNDPEIHGWFSYAKVRFGALNHWVGSVDENSEGSRLWSWLFASEWHTTDNTVKGAAARIRWYLQHGIPDNWEQQRLGNAPLCYRPQVLSEDEQPDPSLPQFIRLEKAAGKTIQSVVVLHENTSVLVFDDNTYSFFYACGMEAGCLVADRHPVSRDMQANSAIAKAFGVDIARSMYEAAVTAEIAAASSASFERLMKEFEPDA